MARSRDLAHFAAVGAGLALLALAQALSFDAHATADPQAMVERLSGLALAGGNRTQALPIRVRGAH